MAAVGQGLDVGLGLGLVEAVLGDDLCQRIVFAFESAGLGLRELVPLGPPLASSTIVVISPFPF